MIFVLCIILLGAVAIISDKLSGIYTQLKRSADASENIAKELKKLIIERTDDGK
jgi:hypothetical protein